MTDTLSETQREQTEELVKGMLHSLRASEKYLATVWEGVCRTCGATCVEALVCH